MSTGTKCDMNKKQLENIIANEDARNEWFEENSVVNKIADEGKELQDILDNEYPIGRFIDVSVVNEKMNKLYGPMSTAKKIAIKIRALMASNEILAEYILEYAIERIGENSKVGTAVRKNKAGDLVQVERHLVLSRFPVSTLKNIYTEALKPSFSTEGTRILNFNGILTNLVTPKQRALKEPSGSFMIVQRAVSNYANRISHRIKRFSSPHKEKGKTAWTGMNNVYTGIEDLVKYHPGYSDPELKNKYVSFFSRFMDGRIFVNKEERIIRKGQKDERIIKVGEWMIYADHGPLTDKKGYTLTYGKGGDVIHGYQNPVVLDEFTPPNREKGAWFIDMPKNANKKFFELVKEARTIDDAVLPYFERAMGASLKEVRTQLNRAFPNLKESEINLILFKNKDIKAKPLVKAILSKLTKEQLELYEEMHEAFEPMLQNEFVMALGDKVEKRKDHWPGMFDENLYLPMLEHLIFELQNSYDSLNLLYKNEKDEKGNKYNNEELSKIRKTLIDLKSKLNYSNAIKDKINGYPVDLTQNLIANLANDNKYFKRVSGAYDRRQVRTDNGVYFDYLKNMSATVERNYLVASLIKSIVVSKEKNTPKMHKVVTRASINLFKVPFHGTDIYRTGFLNRLLPFLPNTTEGYNKVLNKIPGLGLLDGKLYRNKTAMQLNKTYKFVNSYLTGTYLSGLQTTVQNLGDSLRNLIYSSWDEAMYAFALYRDKAPKKDKDGNMVSTRDNLERIIEMSGITEFSDFFSRSMVNGIVKRQMEAAVADGILKAMMDYANANINANLRQRKKNLDKFENTVNELLAKSDSIYKPSDFLKTDSSIKDIKMRRKQIKQDRRIMFANKLVQFAIEKEFVFRDFIRQSPWKKFSKMKAEQAIEMYKQTSTIGMRITMSSTESFIRSLSFIIGLNRAQKAGLMNQEVPWYEFTDSKDINEAISIGRTYQERLNFGLSTQAVGEYFYNGWGMLQGKFKYWSNQKFGADVRLWNEAYRTMKSMEKIESNSFDFKALTKMFSQLLNPALRGKTLRTTNPEIAALRTFMLTQLPITVAFDAFTLGLFPAGGMLAKGARSAFYYLSGSKALRGFTSDLVSLSIAPFLIATLIFGDGFEDEEDPERAVKYYLRKTFFGFVPMWAFDNIIALAAIIGDSTKRGVEGLIDASSVLRGGQLPWNTMFFNPIAKGLVED